MMLAGVLAVIIAISVYIYHITSKGQNVSRKASTNVSRNRKASTKTNETRKASTDATEIIINTAAPTAVAVTASAPNTAPESAASEPEPAASAPAPAPAPASSASAPEPEPAASAPGSAPAAAPAPGEYADADAEADAESDAAPDAAPEPARDAQNNNTAQDIATNPPARDIDCDSDSSCSESAKSASGQAEPVADADAGADTGADTGADSDLDSGQSGPDAPGNQPGTGLGFRGAVGAALGTTARAAVGTARAAAGTAVGTAGAALGAAVNFVRGSSQSEAEPASASATGSDSAAVSESEAEEDENGFLSATEGESEEESEGESGSDAPANNPQDNERIKIREISNKQEVDTSTNYVLINCHDYSIEPAPLSRNMAGSGRKRRPWDSIGGGRFSSSSQFTSVNQANSMGLRQSSASPRRKEQSVAKSSSNLPRRLVLFNELTSNFSARRTEIDEAKKAKNFERVHKLLDGLSARPDTIRAAKDLLPTVEEANSVKQNMEQIKKQLQSLRGVEKTSLDEFIEKVRNNLYWKEYARVGELIGAFNLKLHTDEDVYKLVLKQNQGDGNVDQVDQVVIMRASDVTKVIKALGQKLDYADFSYSDDILASLRKYNAMSKSDFLKYEKGPLTRLQQSVIEHDLDVIQKNVQTVDVQVTQDQFEKVLRKIDLVEDCVTKSKLYDEYIKNANIFDTYLKSRIFGGVTECPSKRRSDAEAVTQRNQQAVNQAELKQKEAEIKTFKEELNLVKQLNKILKAIFDEKNLKLPPKKMPDVNIRPYIAFNRLLSTQININVIIEEKKNMAKLKSELVKMGGEIIGLNDSSSRISRSTTPDEILSRLEAVKKAAAEKAAAEQAAAEKAAEKERAAAEKAAAEKAAEKERAAAAEKAAAEKAAEEKRAAAEQAAEQAAAEKAAERAERAERAAAEKAAEQAEVQRKVAADEEAARRAAEKKAAEKKAAEKKAAEKKAAAERAERDMYGNLEQVLSEKCRGTQEQITLYVLEASEQQQSEIVKLVNKLNSTVQCRLQGGTRRGASLGMFEGGWTHVDFKLSKNQVGTLGNLAFFNVVKFARYRYLTKESDLDIDIKLFVDFLSTTIVCVFLQAFHKEKLALGSLVDQVVSMSLYRKFKNRNLLLLPYYVPFVYE